MADTGPDKIWTLDLETLQASYLYLSQERWTLFDLQEGPKLDVRLTELRSAIQLRLSEVESRRQHGLSVDQGSTILYYAKWTLGVAFATLFVAILALQSDIHTSKSRPATSSQASPASSPQTVPNDAVSEPQPAAKQVLAVPLASPTPESTSTPEPSPS